MSLFDESKAYMEPKELGMFTRVKFANGEIIVTVITSRFNVACILQGHPRYESLKFNEFNRTVYYRGKPIDDNTISREAVWMEATYQIRPSIDLVLQTMNMVAETRKYNPLKEYFGNRRWDGVPRLETVLETYFGAQPSKLNRAYSKKWFIGAVRRALYTSIETPVKFENVLLLYGGQGLGKSQTVEALAIKPEWFGDVPLDISNKDSIMMFTGKFLYELKELAKRSKDMELEKAFLDTKVDSYRPPYGKVRVDIPRRTSFIATTNRLDLLNDSTGSRRWWPVICGYDWDSDGNMSPWPAGRMIDVAGLKAVVDELWLEAIHYASQPSEIHWLTFEEEKLRINNSEPFTVTHPMANTILSIIEDLHDNGHHYFQPDDIIMRMDIPLSQKDHKLRLIVESVLRGNGYTKTKRRTNDGSRRWLWGYNAQSTETDE